MQLWLGLGLGLEVMVRFGNKSLWSLLRWWTFEIADHNH